MAQRVQIILEDDIDGGEATQTVTFGLDGYSYEIDLNDTNADKIRGALAPFVEKGRRLAGGKSSRKVTAASVSKQDGPSAKEIREWAQANGHEVPERGRIPEQVREAYDVAQGILSAPKAPGGGRKGRERRAASMEEIEKEKASV